MLGDVLEEAGRSRLLATPWALKRSVDGGAGVDGGDGGDGGYGGDGVDGGELTERVTLRQGDNGLRILSSEGTSYSNVRVGWVHLDGDEATMRNARIIRRFGKGKSLAWLAKHGPWEEGTKEGTKLLDLAEEDNAWRPHVFRDLVADPEAWAKWCPRPSGSGA